MAWKKIVTNDLDSNSSECKKVNKTNPNVSLSLAPIAVKILIFRLSDF